MREYLHRWGLKSTLSAFDNEKPRDSTSISNKNLLRKSLGLDRYAGRLKRKLSEDEKLPATLEMMVSYHLLKKSPVPDTKQALVNNINKTNSITTGHSPEQKDNRYSSPHRSPFQHNKEGDSNMVSGLGPRPPPSTSISSETNKNAFLMDELRSIGTDTAVGRNELGRSRMEGLSQRPSASRMLRPSSAPPKQHLLRRPQSQPSQPQNDLIMEDVEDDFDFSHNSLNPTSIMSSRERSSEGLNSLSLGGTGLKRSTPLPTPEDIDFSMLRTLERLLLGKGRSSPPESWVQGFYFSENPKLGYGIVQEEGGPCGVLAAVQASILDALMDMYPNVLEWIANPTLIHEKRWKATVKALSRIIKQSSSGSQFPLKIVGSKATSTANMNFREYINSLEVYTVNGIAGAECVLDSLKGQLQERKGYGLLTFLFSVLITRGPSTISEDMDDPSCGLVGGYGYCTQDLVNLLLSGRAVTNVFDGDHSLDEHTTLHGVKSKTRCGFLTIFEWYKHLEVGTHMKDPYKPIWVVNSESHFSVLFGADRKLCDPSHSRKPLTNAIDLYYYDELANQDDIIHLTVSPNKISAFEEAAGDESSDDLPPLEKVIQTKWPKVNIDWNGSEPIL